MKIQAIVTIPPYAPFIKEVARHPIVNGLRLNTVMPTKGSLEELLRKLNSEARNAGDKNLWIDLKCRQLRVKEYWVPPYTEIRLSHSIKVETPVKAYFSDGREAATVLKVDGDRLIMLEGPKRVVGPGEAINIIHPSLTIEGYLTETDKRYVEAGLKAGVKNFMLSFVEGSEDAKALLPYATDANIIAKIESKKGLGYVEKEWKDMPRLMAARGDMFVEVKMPHDIIDAVEKIIRKDSDAIVASRIFGSLSETLEPSCSDIGDVDNLLRMGYKTFMFGDDICMQRDSIISGLNLLSAMAEKYER
jgi:pyruvate kinase